MKTLALAWRQLRRDIRAGEVRILLAALVLSVLAVGSVGMLTERAERALAMEANRLLGGDAVLRGDAPLPDAHRQRAAELGLQQAETLQFPSMIRAAENLRLGEIRALGEGFPLRGSFRVRDATGERVADAVPEPGTAWLSRAGAEALGVGIGDRVGVGELQLRISALVLQEPDAALDYFNTAPRVFVSMDELPASGLLQLGARINYRLIVAGDASAVERWTSAVKSDLERGQRLETTAEARPEVRRALDQAGRFLGLAALVAVVLAAIAVAMAARRHAERHMQGAAILRCLGASQARLVGIQLGELLLLGLIGSALGLMLAWGLQAIVAGLLADRLGMVLPGPGWRSFAEGAGVGLTVLLAFAAPPVLALRRVPALRVLRRDLDPTEPSAWLVALLGLGGLALLLWWRAGSAELGAAMLGGIGATLLALGVLAWLLIAVMRRFRRVSRGPLRYGLANVSRRPATSVAQIAALGLGIMVLLLLGFVRSDLLERWRNALPADAPNRFLINVQSEQLEPLQRFFDQRGLLAPELWPMVRGRWVGLNGDAPDLEAFDGRGDRGRRLAEREFNLSVMRELHDDNRVVAGEYRLDAPDGPELSVEEGLARTLGWKLGDTVAFDVAGQTLQGRITSLREVEWERFRPNFFVLVSPGALDGFAASHITAFKLPEGHGGFTAALVDAFPNLTVIDIDAVLEQVRSTMDQVSTVVEAVFLFSLAAGVLVLLAAVSASQDERLQEGGVMRVLGGSARQLRLAQASEFAAIGLLAGGTAAIAASILAGVIARQVFELPWQPSFGLAFTGGAIGVVASLVAGMLATRRVVRVPPARTLRELDA
ncbi:MAG TPA: FtsX-like permease family protein [Arenimonas sp.]|nr:FtsX-like permease family protein [Arenimonas sp.]